MYQAVVAAKTVFVLRPALDGATPERLRAQG